jgi:hypothetical protein
MWLAGDATMRCWLMFFAIEPAGRRPRRGRPIDE